jgi:serine/threonine-protein kinase HipA
MNKLQVNIKFGLPEEKVGVLTHVDGQQYFKYDASFLKRKLNISPFKLPFDDRIHSCPLTPFDQLFGVFGDSLPDGWGRLIMDRYLLAQQKSPDAFSPLERLSLIGSKGPGALTYHPEQLLNTDENVSVDLTEYAEKAIQLLDSENVLVSDEFYRLTGTSGGARPKIQVKFNTQTNILSVADQIQGEQESLWIIKFPSTNDLKDIANVEFAYYLMAIDAGIDMSSSRLFKGKEGKVYFGTKRFDRIDSNRLHIHSVAGLLHDDFRRSQLDYGHILDAGIRLEKNKQVVEKIMRLAMFNVLMANQDDHSKNFSFLMDEKGVWSFAPAYDLTFSPTLYGFQTTSVAANNKNIGLSDFDRLGNHFQFKDTAKIWKQVKAVA